MWLRNRSRVIGAVVLVVMLALVVAPSGALALDPPCRFFGSVKIDGQPAEKGTAIRVWLQEGANTTWEQEIETGTNPTGGPIGDDVYLIDVPAYDPTAPGANEGDIVHFSVEGILAQTGTWARGEFVEHDLTVTTLDAPTSFSASAAGSTQIDLSWSKGSGAEKTKIQRKQGSYPASKDDGTQVYYDTGTTYPDTGLAPSTTYYYRAWSYVQGSEQWSDNYAEASATTASGIVAPMATTSAATPVEETAATLNGVINSDGGEACQYRFEYDTDSGEPYAYSTDWTGSKTTGQPFSEPLSSLSKGTKYYFRAQAKNSAGTASGSELTFLTKPDAPTSFGATPAGSTQIDLSWSKGSGAEKTKIQRKQGSYPASKDDGTQVYFDTGTTYPDTGLAPGTTYYYRAWSHVQGSEQWSDNYAEASATTAGGLQSELNGQVYLQGRPTAPDASWENDLTVVVFEQGSSTVVDTYAVTTNATGGFSFVFDHALGTYDIGVKGSHTLSRLEEDVVIDSATTNVDFGTLLEGDCDDNDVVNINDFGILADAYSSVPASGNWDDRADLNGDGAVNIYDFGLLADNYGLLGEMV